MKIVESLEESGLLIKGVSKTIKNEAKEQKRRFFGILLGSLAASLLGSALAGKRKVRGSDGTIELVKEQLELDRIFNAASSFH